MKLKLLILVLALQSAWLLGTVAVQEHALATGKVILLETARVDPRDLLQRRLSHPELQNQRRADEPVFAAGEKGFALRHENLRRARAGDEPVLRRGQGQHQRVHAGGGRSFVARQKRPGRVGMQQPIPSTLNMDWNVITSPKARAIRLANSPRRPSCPRPDAETSRKCSWTANPTPRR